MTNIDCESLIFVSNDFIGKDRLTEYSVNPPTDITKLWFCTDDNYILGDSKYVYDKGTWKRYSISLDSHKHSKKLLDMLLQMTYVSNVKTFKPDYIKELENSVECSYFTLRLYYTDKRLYIIDSMRNIYHSENVRVLEHIKYLIDRQGKLKSEFKEILKLL